MLLPHVYVKPIECNRLKHSTFLRFSNMTGNVFLQLIFMSVAVSSALWLMWMVTQSLMLQMPGQ